MNSAPPAPLFRRIDRLIIRVPSVESAAKFYANVCGLPLIKQDARLASFRLGDGNDAPELVLHADADLPAEAVYLLVDDVRSLYRRRAELQLTFTSRPTPAARGYRAAIKDPFGAMFLVIDRTLEREQPSASHPSGRPTAIENAKPPGALFAGVTQKWAAKKEVLARLYIETARTADDLPYTPQFERLYDAYAGAFGDPKPTRAETWRHLLNLRKAGVLAKLGEAKSVAPPVSPEAEATLRQLLGSDIGKRDRLPYSDRFELVVQAFNRTQPRPMAPHHVWRLAAKLAK